MAYESKNKTATVKLAIGSIKNPCRVLRASTGYAGIKSGKTKGSLYMEIECNEDVINTVEALPKIKEMVETTKAEIAALNAQIQQRIESAPTDDIKDKLKAELWKWVNWYQPSFVDEKNGNYDQRVDDKGRKLYIVKLKQLSLKKQLDAGKSIDEMFYVNHMRLNPTTNAWERVVDGNGKAKAIQVFSDSLVAISVRTTITKYPTDNKYTLTMNRLNDVYHVLDAKPSVEEAGDIFDGDDLPEIVDVVEEYKAEEKGNVKTEQAPANPDAASPYAQQQTAPENPYAEQQQAPAAQATKTEENPYAT